MPQSSSSTERPFLPFITESLPLHDNKNVNNNEMNLNQSIIYQNDSQFDYQQRYRTQFRNTTPFTQPQPDSPFRFSSLQQVLPTSPTVDTDFPFILSQLLEQCSMIHSRIGKYRIDPLTETERSNIIDQVYFTAESMLSSIKELHNSSHRNKLPTRQENDTMDTTMVDDISSSPISSLNKLEDPASDEYKMIRQARNLQDNNMRPKYRRRSKRSMIGQRCHSCNTTETPEWRRGPDGARTLCNACGLHYSKLLRKGSMTVQSHNYLLDMPDHSKRSPRVIQFPIIQVNSTTDARGDHNNDDNKEKDVG
ncbi:hypothetical protein INT48_004011 [Thamnidium elegans]|uniref:GATA-type domain-containing protein n=1 Tax=Thamnidium elegans TaxID=101142 RepID=A0A8H7SHJ3_9FUNG|nr:hypothetical protein INT48_004011 [Thamnidium elegans]